jgi:hypothetical protein
MYSVKGLQITEIEDVSRHGVWRSAFIGWIKGQVLGGKGKEFRQVSKNVSADRRGAASQLKKARNVGFE